MSKIGVAALSDLVCKSLSGRINHLGGAKYANGVAAGGDERWGYGCESGDEDTDDEAGSSEGHIEGFVSRPGEEKSDSCSD